MSDQPCQNSQNAVTADRAAAELFQIAALLLGEEGLAVSAVESAIQASEIDPCHDPERSRDIVRENLFAAAIQLSSKGREGEFEAPKTPPVENSCLKDDDLAAAGITVEQLSQLLAGAASEKMRAWLDGLAPVARVIFVLRALCGISNTQAASLLEANAGPLAKGWSVESVSTVFRQALCSLTSSLLHTVQITGE